ncbi:hypothetical protein O9929_21410 [Vibrio lentus]|nr:hypothetical protein [Vibrio lentus]
MRHSIRAYRLVTGPEWSWRMVLEQTLVSGHSAIANQEQLESQNSDDGLTYHIKIPLRKG